MNDKLLGANRMRRVADKVKKELPPNMGFCVWVYPHGEHGMCQYISNSQRADMIEAVQSWLDRQSPSVPTPEEN